MACVLCIGFSRMVSAQALPAGEGADTFRKMCSACHGVNTATSQRRSSAEWSSTVHDMVTRGAQGSPADIENVITYLSTNFGLGKAPVVTASAVPPPTAAAAQGVALSADDIAKGSELIKANGCLACHRVRGEGSYTGPELSDIGAHRTPAQIEQSLVSPSKEVLPENRAVRIMTRDGKVVSGRILNQDGQSVQLIDSSSRLRSFQRSELREFSIVSENPMPSYSGKMSTEDLQTLTRYLGSLKEVDIR